MPDRSPSSSPSPRIRSWDDWFAAAEASGLSGADWLDRWWTKILPGLRRAHVRWEGPAEVPERAWSVARWGAEPRREHGLVNWDRRSPHTWREALSWGLLAYRPQDYALARGHTPPVAHPMAVPHSSAQQWYALGLRFTTDDVSFWMERMQESGCRSHDGPSHGGCSDVAWCSHMGQVEGPLRAAVETGGATTDGLNAQVERWWACFEGLEKQGGLVNAPYLLNYLLKHGFAGAEHWRQRLLAGQSHWDAITSSTLLAVAQGTPLEVLGRSWAVGPVGPLPWTFAHACTAHFQRPVESHEVFLPADIWWFALNGLKKRNAPLFFSAPRPTDGARVTPWEQARALSENPQGANHQALNREAGIFQRSLDPAIRQAVLESMANLRHEEALALVAGSMPDGDEPARPRRRSRL